MAETDADGNVIKRYDYDLMERWLAGRPRMGPGYTEHVSDAATGLSYMQQRYMDPQLGVFLSVDPVGVSPHNGLNFNRYWYTSSNPYTKTDPDGRCDGPATCAIDRDIAAMNRGEMTKDEFMDRSEARATGAVAGLAIVATAVAGIEVAAALGARVLRLVQAPLREPTRLVTYSDRRDTIWEACARLWAEMQRP